MALADGRVNWEVTISRDGNGIHSIPIMAHGVVTHVVHRRGGTAQKSMNNY